MELRRGRKARPGRVGAAHAGRREAAAAMAMAGGSECGRDNPILSLPRDSRAVATLLEEKKRRVVVCEKALKFWFSLNICLGINPLLYFKKTTVTYYKILSK